ncbi:PKD domain-containing protein [Halopiger djelfimassiliensis]|uniref:PKD domain-containing protein n=1 Tax=Halopiger djelfimassiliensis TaxID=1293047 RepID=UPI000677C05F|nr:PKD domain-containing protein [Halopiger djelfimassiliensis]
MIATSGLASATNADAEPVANIDLTPRDPVYNPITFDASGSRTPADGIERYDWYFTNRTHNPDEPLFGSEPVRSGATIEAEFPDGETFEVGLEVVDSAANTGRTTTTFTPKTDPTTPKAVIDRSPDGKFASNPITLDASGSTSPNGDIVEYNWEIHDETGATRSETGETIELTLDPEVRQTAQLTVVDETGATETERGRSFWPQ